jgi:FkbM family methyltransferase
VYKEYQWDLDFEVKNILDLGAHWGDSSLFYALQYPNASIYAVEPTPESFARLQTVAKTFPNIIPIQAALGMSRGKLPLYISKSTLGNSLTSRSDKDMQVIVDALSLKDFCERAGVAHFDVIKFDIEGAENVIFQDQSNIKLSKSFIGEIHYDLTNLTPEDIVEFFSSPNLDLIKLNEKRSILRFKNSLL